MEAVEEALGEGVRMVADSGYDSGENLKAVRDKDVIVGMEQERKRAETILKRGGMSVLAFEYEGQKDEYVCPQLRVLGYKRSCMRERAGGRWVEVKEYESETCEGCPTRQVCIQGRHRVKRLGVRVDERWRVRMLQRVESAEGKSALSKRKTTVERVFGAIKQNLRYREFVMRGARKVRGEWAMICTVMNLLGLWVKREKERMQVGGPRAGEENLKERTGRPLILAGAE